MSTVDNSRATLDRSRPPRPGPAPNIRLPSYQRIVLANGLTVLTVRHDGLPEVSARLVVSFGATNDPANRSGTALLVARALTEGTTRRSARQVAESLDFLGTRLTVDVTHDASVLSLQFLSRVFDSALDLLAEIVTQPAFDDAEVERLQDERLDEIASGLDEPRIVANNRLIEAIFGRHTYALNEGGVEETVRAIDSAGLRAFHGRFYRPRSATLVLVGDVPEPSRLEERLQAAFGDWVGEPATPQAMVDAEKATGRRFWIVQWPGPQSEIRVGGIGISRLDEEYPAVIVMNAILGGLFSSRMNMKLREEKGWTYGVRSWFDARKNRGPYCVATAVEAQATAEAVGEILHELERLKSEPPTPEELELAKNSLTFSLPRLFETVSQVAGRVSQQVVYGLPDDYWTTHIGRVRAVTLTDVLEAAERHLDSDRVAVVVVGPATDFHADLRSFGTVEVRDIRGRPAVL